MFKINPTVLKRKTIGSTYFTKHMLKEIKERIEKANFVLNVGCGDIRLTEEFDLDPELEKKIYNTDIYKSPITDKVVSVYELDRYFEEERFDLVINFAVLEHLHYPLKAIEQMYKILKKGGIIFSEMPFIEQFHEYPSDFHRASDRGLMVLHEQFKPIKVRIHSGPTSTVRLIVGEYFTLFTPFKKLNLALKGIFLLVTWPFKYIDWIIPDSRGFKLAKGFYYVGQKK